MKRVVFSARAERQLEALHWWVEERSGPDRAEAFTSGIVEYCQRLASFPDRGTRRDDLRPGLRVLGYRRRVTIALTVEPREVVILGLYYCGQNYEADLIVP